MYNRSQRYVYIATNAVSDVLYVKSLKWYFMPSKESLILLFLFYDQFFFYLFISLVIFECFCQWHRLDKVTV
jgi:hypothetical protein